MKTNWDRSTLIFRYCKNEKLSSKLALLTVFCYVKFWPILKSGTRNVSTRLVIFWLTMGQSLRCLSCESRNTKVKSFGTVPRGKKYSKSTLSVLRNASFHRPMHSSLERLPGEVSRRSSLASISLGSAQTLSLIKVESANNETTLDAGKDDGSVSTKRHPGMFYNILKLYYYIKGILEFFVAPKGQGHPTRILQGTNFNCSLFFKIVCWPLKGKFFILTQFVSTEIKIIRRASGVMRRAVSGPGGGGYSL